ncbi:MAG: replication restart helicase PriA [bacterium]
MEGVGERYVQVAVQKHLDMLFTYHLPDSAIGLIHIGTRVLVDFKGREEIGVITGFGNPESIVETKPVLSTVDAFPFLSEREIDLAIFLSEYYLSPIGETISAMVPGGIGISCEDIFALPEKGVEMSKLWESSEKMTGALMKFISKSGSVSFSEIKDRFGPFEILSPLRELVDKGLISVKRFVTNKRDVLKDGFFIPSQKLISESETIIGKKKVEFVSELIRAERYEFKRAIGRFKINLISEMLRDGLIFFIFNTSTNIVKMERPQLPEPTVEQEIALKQLNETLEKKRVHLIFGASGSGKTYLYIKMAEKVLDVGRSVIVLVPEISLTPQAIERYTSAFGDCVRATHSNMTPKQRFDVWKRAREGTVRLVIGPRSSIFTPFDNLGLIVVDEEHDSSYKQSDTDPRYNARDVALYIGRRYSIPVILGSSTPSLDTYYRAITRKYAISVLKERVENYPMPEVEIVDMRRAEKDARTPIFSLKLTNEIEKTLSEGRQVIVLQNRRGFATVAICKSCGWTVRCRNCDVTMTYHKGMNILICHYCYHKRSVPKTCPECGEEKIELLGFGTERVVEDLKRAVGDVNIARMDTDATRKRGSHAEILSEFDAGRFQVLVGTQMVSKGLDYPNVGLVGVVNADTSLVFPDFRAGERTYQLIAQVVGRSGRSSRGGRAIIQTFHPIHYSIELASRLDYAHFFEREMEYRRRLLYPPYSRLAVIHIEDRRVEKARENAQRVREAILRGGVVGGVRVIGPAPAPISKMKGYFRWQILIFARRVRDIHETIRAIKGVRFGKYGKFGRLAIDIDPEDLL